MSDSATAGGSPLSTVPRRTAGSAGHVLIAFAAACGWHTGQPGSAAGGATVTGASLEPGLRAALEVAVAQEAVARGAGEVEVAIRSVEEVPLATTDATGTAAWSTRVRVAAGRPGRPGCGGELTAERAWVAFSPDQAVAARADAAGAVAEELGRRAVDSVEAGCR